MRAELSSRSPRAGQCGWPRHGHDLLRAIRLIILPQAFRNSLILLTQTIILFQDTSLVYAIGAYDLLRASARRENLWSSGRPTCWPVVYFVMCFGLSYLVKKCKFQNRHHSLNIR
jgi:glutamate/aspartate transport system permease protein